MEYRKRELKNGVKLVTVPQASALSVSILVLVDAGAKNEDKKIAGISHFIEHLGFKGTLNRPSSLDLASEFDALGANYNAFTSHDFTGYYVTVIPEKAEVAAELLADLYLNPLYPEEEIKKEKGVVLEEIKMYEDKPSSFVWDVFAETAYGDTPAGKTVLGDSETVASLTREDLLAYRQKHYLAHATTIVVVGNFAEAKLTKILENKFAGFNGGAAHPWPPMIDGQVEANYQLAVRPSKQAHLVLGFKSANMFDDKTYALDVLAAILGGGMSSRLFQKVRGELGAAYYIGASQNEHIDHGYLAIYAGIDAKRINEVLSVIGAELKLLKDELVSETELNRVKDGLVGNLFLGLETPSDQTYFYGEQVALGKEVLTPSAYADKIRAITASELKDLANEIFVDSRLNLAIVGPELDLAGIKSIIKL